MNRVAHREALRARGIDADVIVGGLCMGGKPPEGSTLKDCGFDVLVLCAEEIQRGKFDGIAVIKCPLDDSELTQAEWLRAVTTAAKVARFVGGGLNCLVTCYQGRNRSGLVTCAALRMLTGWPGEYCVRYVRQGRTGADALTNTSFVKALERMG